MACSSADTRQASSVSKTDGPAPAPASPRCCAEMCDSSASVTHRSRVVPRSLAAAFARAHTWGLRRTLIIFLSGTAGAPPAISRAGVGSQKATMSAAARRGRPYCKAVVLLGLGGYGASVDDLAADGKLAIAQARLDERL